MLTIAHPLIGMPLDAGNGAGTRNVTVVSFQIGATAAAKDVANKAQRGHRRETLGIRADSRVTDARRKWAATEEDSKRLRVLRGLGGSDSPRSFSQASLTNSTCYAAFRVRAATDLLCPACHGGSDARRKWAAKEEAPKRLRVLRGLGGSDSRRSFSQAALTNSTCYAAFRVRAATDLLCPACRAIVPVEEADRRALQQQIEEVMEEAMVVVR